jgi:hypothetical protein
MLPDAFCFGQRIFQALESGIDLSGSRFGLGQSRFPGAGVERTLARTLPSLVAVPSALHAQLAAIRTLPIYDPNSVCTQAMTLTCDTTVTRYQRLYARDPM